MTCLKVSCRAECWYCDAKVRRHEHDHAPVPRDAGGAETVTVCITCHDLKDRRTLDTWPLEFYIGAMRSLSPDDFTSPADWPRRWDSLSTSARLVWAKWAAMVARQTSGFVASQVGGHSGYALLLRE